MDTKAVWPWNCNSFPDTNESEVTPANHNREPDSNEERRCLKKEGLRVGGGAGE